MFILMFGGENGYVIMVCGLLGDGFAGVTDTL